MHTSAHGVPHPQPYSRAMAKKRNNACPRRKRLSRKGRLQSAKATGWVQSYRGKNLIRGYCKWFAVDPVCAIIELRQLGVRIDAEREAHYRELADRKADARRARRQVDQMQTEDLWDSDETFAYIAGYTPAGFPYGVTWEEYDASASVGPEQDGEPGLPASGEDATA